MAAISDDVMKGEGGRGRRMDGDEKEKEMREEEKGEIITQRTEIAAEQHNRPGQGQKDNRTGTDAAVQSYHDSSNAGSFYSRSNPV